MRASIYSASRRDVFLAQMDQVVLGHNVRVHRAVLSAGRRAHLLECGAGDDAVDVGQSVDGTREVAGDGVGAVRPQTAKRRCAGENPDEWTTNLGCCPASALRAAQRRLRW